MKRTRTKFSRLWKLQNYFVDGYNDNEAILRPEIVENKNGTFKAGSFFVNKVKLPKLVQELMKAEYERGRSEIKRGLQKLLK